MSQRKYALDIISEAGLLGAKPVEFPMGKHHQLALADGPLFDDPEKYRRLMGRLIYLAVTGPDLAYSVHILSQFMQDPKVVHWEASLIVVRYLKNIQDKGYYSVLIVISALRGGVILIGLAVLLLGDL